jgi:two-component system phosphate regulon sensor histidine kinase PhoR
MERHLLEDVTGRLVDEAAIAALAIQQSGREITLTAPRMARELGKKSSSRVTIVATNGTVIGDSELPGEDLRSLDNHLNRPEIRQALVSETGSSVRYSTTLNKEMLYVAAAIRHDTEISGIVRLALPLTTIDQMKKSLHATLLGGLAIAAAISLIMSSLFSQLVYRPVRRITRLAEEIGSGNLSSRIQVNRKDEFGNLAKVMNDMALKIQEQMESLASERNRLDAILRGMGEGVMVTGADGAISMVNPAFCTLFGVEEDLIGRELIDISRHPALHDAYKLVTGTRTEHLEEIRIRLPDEKTVLTHWVPLMTGKELRGIVAVFHDITELKRLENIRRDFVANVSHELRTPVTVIKGYAETLLDGVLTRDPDRAANFVSVILKHSERLAALIGDLLTLSEMEAGDFTLELKPVNLAVVIRHAANLLEMKRAEKGITIDLENISGHSTSVLADQRRLEQVFINLIDNAIKYTPQGGKVTLTVQESEAEVIIRVSDTGPGIPLQSLPRIFERFYRVDSARSRDQGGTGLGLAIVKHIVQLHGGAITVESPPGKGATFSVTLKKSG